MHALSRWWMRRRHGEGEWGGLFAPSSAGEWVSLDLETTGIDPARDHILSLAAVPVRDGTAWVSQRFERRVHTARAFGIESIRHHRITPDEASAGEPVTEVVREFLHWLGGRRLLGYNLGFDLDMLAPHVRALTGFDLPNPQLDLADAVVLVLDATVGVTASDERIVEMLRSKKKPNHELRPNSPSVTASRPTRSCRSTACRMVRLRICS